jgi:AraC-like DNA-binding protein
MAIHAGNPVDGDPSLFGSALKFSSFMCNESNGAPITISNTVKELAQASGIKIEDDRIACLSKQEEDFSKKMIKLLYDHWQDPDFDINKLCKILAMSKSQLYRNCIGVLGKPSNRLLRDFRLEQALQMLDSNKNISQTTFDCGFNNPSYFTKCFQKRYGIKPTDYRDVATE